MNPTVKAILNEGVEPAPQTFGNCKNCAFWRNGKCEAVDQQFAWPGDEHGPVEPGNFKIDVAVDDDSGLWVELVTGPDFGCTRFNQR